MKITANENDINDIARSLQFNLKCTGDDNRELSKRLQYVVDIVFIGRDFHYKALQHFSFSCTKEEFVVRVFRNLHGFSAGF